MPIALTPNTSASIAKQRLSFMKTSAPGKRPEAEDRRRVGFPSSSLKLSPSERHPERRPSMHLSLSVFAPCRNILRPPKRTASERNVSLTNVPTEMYVPRAYSGPEQPPSNNTFFPTLSSRCNKKDT